LSEEFLRVAKKEVSDDITEIGNLLKDCQNDNDVLKNISAIEKCIHKIKGLAPMMGHSQIGELATLLDKLLKIALDGKMIPDIYSTVKNSYLFMLDSISGTKANFAPLKSQIKNKYANFLHQ
jgi:chemotaxis protein histidine kinase CheA